MSNQPKWAWWVVGIVIPVLGIVVSIKLATTSGSGDKAAPSNGTTAGVTGGVAPAATSPKAAPQADAPPQVLAGPTRITLRSGANYVDLDTAGPVPQPAGKGTDLTVGFNVPPPALDIPGSANLLAPAPNQDADPTPAECTQAISKRGTYTSGDLAQGGRFCLQTDEGRIAALRVATVPTLSGVALDVTVWQ